MTLDGSVMHAPKETGLTLSRSELPAAPLIPGKTGESISSVAAFARSVEMIQEKFEFYCMEMARLRDRFELGICNCLPESKILFKGTDRLPTCSVIAFPPVFSESLLFLLNTKGVYASCGGGKFQLLSHVLKASGIEENLVQSSLSFCFSYEITEEEIDRLVAIIEKCVKQLKECAGELFNA